MKKILDDIKKSIEADVKNLMMEKRMLLIKTAAVLLITAAVFFIVINDNDDREEKAAEEILLTTEETASSKVYVDIGGAVNTPIVAELEEGSRVEDAIAAAGGLSEDADISQINRAAFVEDGEKIFVPYIMEQYDGLEQDILYNAGYFDGKININTADSQELQELSGIGPVIAESIINYREENGRFKNIEDIKNVSGIGDKIFEKVKDEIKT